MAISFPRDNNRITVIGGTSSADGVTPVLPWVDPTTHRLLVDNAIVAGIVTSVSVVSANGFAGTVATATTTPAITLSTTITGILQGNGTAISATSTTGSGAVVLGTSPTLATPVINGLPTGTGVASAATASTLVSRDANANVSINNLFESVASTASAGGTTVLTIASAYEQILTGALNQTFQLPDATTLPLSTSFVFNNNSSGTLTITNAGTTALYTVPAGGEATVTCTVNGTANGSWDIHPRAPGTVTWGSGVTGLVFNTALTTTPSISAGISSAANPSFIPQRGSSTTGYGGDSTNLYGSIGGSAAFTATATNFTGAGTITGTQHISTIATGTAPLVVTSTTPVANLSIGGNAATATKLSTARNINGVSFDGSANILTPDVLWTATTIDATMAINNGYIANKGTLLTLTLPTTATVGTVLHIAGMNAGLWKIAQNASGIIHFGNLNTTTGVGGSIASTATYDCVELVCIVANNEWVVTSSVGNITVV